MSVLYDIPGPQSRRRTLIGSLVAGAIVLAVLVVVVVRLAEQEQFTAEKWGPLLDPTTDEFPLVWQRIGLGLQATLAAAALAVVFSLVVGTLLAVTRLVSAPWYRWLVVGVVELLRGLPVVVTIFFAARALPALGVDLPTLAYLVIGLTLYNSVIIAEIVRAGVASLPRGQAEAAAAVGMTRGQSLRLIQLPQAFRVMLPALISQLVVVLKDTALGFIILYPELLRTAQIVVQTTRNPLQMFFVIAVIFILINYALSRLATYVEKRLSRSRTTPDGAAPGPVVQEGAVV
ncbi:amino acid ABC transporter permease [Pseudonocardia sp. KRD-184]|uniref:Amino acid ABC transporter permease n=1 Tax=Pseudonocardia oceani TaxID=2792013 RepID=A0ABS6U4J0_9PSEU|nr:amino acid ABC transporter permease [Pseudonocardia oceani]MBW0090140.1 amino acid ABC transporter permease [Pseudonocardia oceani]MBW0097308.1 amino acid ABC transporter permease [Pseudonocardia oceani]MBW0124054.1 amino acid ABC transporter permease [Pseudonocardia oceani]MBW0127140.1 amino acid ABC transporter permease [Pseudonocardia oceani]